MEKREVAVKEKDLHEPLEIASLDEIKRDLAVVSADAETTRAVVIDPELDKRADHFVDTLMSVDEEDFKSQEEFKDTVDGMGLQVQRQSAERSKMLRKPIKLLSQRGANGGDVANALVDLKMKVEDLDPNRYDFSAGSFSRIMGYIPFLGTPLKRYFTKFESADTVIAAIVNSLRNGAEQLRLDNDTLKGDQIRMRELTKLLQKQIQIGQLIDEKLTHRLEQDIPADSPRYKFISEELLFPLRQRIMDLQQQLAVNQQGVLSVEIIRRNNKELIRGVYRAENVTMSALEVAVTVALALADQKIVLEKIQAINKTTSSLIEGTAKRLRTQGVEIHNQASTAQIDMTSLKKAFTDIAAAMNDISAFRQKALPQMAQTIIDLDKLTDESEQAIQRMEQGNRIAPSVIDIAVE